MLLCESEWLRVLCASSVAGNAMRWRQTILSQLVLY